MKTDQTISVASNALPADNFSQRDGNGLGLGYERQRYLITKEAAEYLRKSVSWLVRQPLIPYLPGKPNIYDRHDLDKWVERNKHVPSVA